MLTRYLVNPIFILIVSQNFFTAQTSGVTSRRTLQVLQPSAVNKPLGKKIEVHANKHVEQKSLLNCIKARLQTFLIFFSRLGRLFLRGSYWVLTRLEDQRGLKLKWQWNPQTQKMKTKLKESLRKLMSLWSKVILVLSHTYHVERKDQQQYTLHL